MSNIYRHRIILRVVTVHSLHLEALYTQPPHKDPKPITVTVIESNKGTQLRFFSLAK